MNIRQANDGDFQTVQTIVQQTISEIYPHYYPAGAVRFFLAHHSEAAIRKDLADGLVFLLLTDAGAAAGTVTLRNNEICRLFVLPAHQGNGYGRALMDFAETEIAKQYDEIVLDASFSAKAIYLKRGYTPVSYHTIEADGDYLCYDLMKKRIYKDSGG